MLLPNTIRTKDAMLRVKGKVFYSDRRRRIDLKKPIKELFDSGKYDVSYVMELCLSESRLKERVNKLSEKEIIPVLLYFMREEKK